MEIRQATYKDLDTLMKLFEGAKLIKGSKEAFVNASESVSPMRRILSIFAFVSETDQK